MKTPFTIEKPEDTKHFNGIIYGETGAGKTRLAGTAQTCPEMAPVLFIDFESGTKTLRGQDIDIVRPRSWKEIQEVYEFLLDGNEYYRTVVIDSLTELQKKLSMGTILGELDVVNNQYKDLGRAIAPQISDWLKTGEQMRKVIRAFRDLAYHKNPAKRVHVIMCALEKYDDKKQTVCPNLPGVLGIECGAMVDVLLRLSQQPQVTKNDREVIKRHLIADSYVDQAGTRYLAKNRGNFIPAAMWEPTMARIIGANAEEV